MKQAIKEIFVTFISLYMLVFFSGIFRTFNIILEEKTTIDIPSCEMGHSGDTCNCSCKMEGDGECYCSEKVSTESGFSFLNGRCHDLSSLQSNFLILKFVPATKQTHGLYPKKTEFLSEPKKSYQEYLNPIDHPPPNKLS